jgi:hypothetical protein
LIAVRDTTVVKRYWGHVWAVKNPSSAETTLNSSNSDGAVAKSGETEDADPKQRRSIENADAVSPDRGSPGVSREADFDFDAAPSPLGKKRRSSMLGKGRSAKPGSREAAPGPRKRQAPDAPAPQPVGKKFRRNIPRCAPMM